MADNKEGSNEKPKAVDSDLDALLDDALEDFYKPTPDVASSSKTSSASAIEGEAVTAAEGASSTAADDEAWSKEFMKQAAEEFEKTLGQILGSESSEFTDTFLKLTQAATKEMAAAASGSSVSDTLAETLKNLSENAEAIKNQPDEVKLAKMLAELGMDGQESSEGAGAGDESLGGLANLLPVMQNMMQQLLSKDMLYPSLKEISEKYPEWLERNKATLDAESFSKYERQSQYMREVCIEYEAEEHTDSNEAKQQRFDRIMELMQKTQECGQPPVELAGESNPALNLDMLTGLSGSVPGAEGGCTLM